MGNVTNSPFAVISGAVGVNKIAEQFQPVFYRSIGERMTPDQPFISRSLTTDLVRFQRLLGTMWISSKSIVLPADYLRNAQRCTTPPDQTPDYG